jgi:hypothetical protein
VRYVSTRSLVLQTQHVLRGRVARTVVEAVRKLGERPLVGEDVLSPLRTLRASNGPFWVVISRMIGSK